MTDLLGEIKALILGGYGYSDQPTIGEEVFDQIDTFLARFLGYSDQYRHTQLLWMAHCWAMDCWRHTPRMLIVSPEPNCGKTTALEITQRFVPRGELISNTTEAALYQAIEDSVKEKAAGRPSCTTSWTSCSAIPNTAASKAGRSRTWSKADSSPAAPSSAS